MDRKSPGWMEFEVDMVWARVLADLACAPECTCKPGQALSFACPTHASAARVLNPIPHVEHRRLVRDLPGY